jgi:hypothetical protein
MQTISAPGKRAEAGFWLPLLRRIPRPSLRSPFLIRLRHWEYWPFKVVYFPILLYHFWLSIRARSLFFFSASNPSIETGGMLGESKFAILDRIGEEFKPKTLLVPFASEPLALWVQLTGQGLNFPLIAKPDVGERGWRVEKITNEQALLRYLESSPVDFLIQEFVDEPLELGVFYYRLPSQEKGVVSSIVQKEFLTVKGDGVQCVEGLIRRNERALLQLPALTERYGPQLQRVPDYGEVVTLVSIGNHCLGTTFLNANHLITPAGGRILLWTIRFAMPFGRRSSGGQTHPDHGAQRRRGRTGPHLPSRCLALGGLPGAVSPLAGHVHHQPRESPPGCTLHDPWGGCCDMEACA